MQVKDRGLVLVEANQLAGPVPQDLMAQFRSDRTSRAGHEYNLAFNLPSDRFHIDLNRVPAEKVFQAHISELADLDSPVDNVLERRHGLELQIGLPADVYKSLHLFPCRGADSNQNLLDSVPGSEC